MMNEIGSLIEVVFWGSMALLGVLLIVKCFIDVFSDKDDNSEP